MQTDAFVNQARHVVLSTMHTKYTDPVVLNIIEAYVMQILRSRGEYGLKDRCELLVSIMEREIEDIVRAELLDDRYYPWEARDKASIADALCSTAWGIARSPDLNALKNHAEHVKRCI
jgi:hypothetical protein